MSSRLQKLGVGYIGDDILVVEFTEIKMASATGSPRDTESFDNLEEYRVMHPKVVTEKVIPNTNKRPPICRLHHPTPTIGLSRCWLLYLRIMLM